MENYKGMPGKWRRVDNGVYTEVKAENKKETFIAALFYFEKMKGREIRGNHHSPKIESTGRLIAKAPELLERLSNIIKLRDRSEKPHEFIHDLDKELQKVDKLIKEICK